MRWFVVLTPELKKSAANCPNVDISSVTKWNILFRFSLFSEITKMKPDKRNLHHLFATIYPKVELALSPLCSGRFFS